MFFLSFYLIIAWENYYFNFNKVANVYKVLNYLEFAIYSKQQIAYKLSLGSFLLFSYKIKGFLKLLAKF